MKVSNNPVSGIIKHALNSTTARCLILGESFSGHLVSLLNRET